MARILAVFEFAVELREIRKALGDEYEFLHAQDLAEARQWARAGSIDLVIASTGLKDSDPGYLWVVLGKLVGRGAPFIFIKDPAVQRSLPSATVLSRPLSPKTLVESVEFALKNRKREEGDFQDGGFDKILSRIAEDQLSGVLTAYYDRLIKRVVCSSGRVSFCGSNDPSELVGQAFVRSGLISEKDLMEAIAVQEKTAEPLGKVLQALRKVTQDQVKRTIADKFREAVLDLYLWGEGRWVFQRDGGFAVPPAEEFQLDIGSLRAEGQQRAARWTELVHRLPSHALRFSVNPERAILGSEPTWVERRVMSLARSGGSLGDMVMEVRGQEFPVYDFVAKMLDGGGFRISEENPAANEPLLRALEPDSDGPAEPPGLISTRESEAPSHASRRPPPANREAPSSARPRKVVRARPDPRRESLAGFSAVREAPTDAPRRDASKRDVATDAPKGKPPNSEQSGAGFSHEEAGAALRLISQGQRLVDGIDVTVRDPPRTTIREGGGKDEVSARAPRETLRERRRGETSDDREPGDATVRPGRAGGQPTQLEEGNDEPPESEREPAAPPRSEPPPDGPERDSRPSEPFGVIRATGGQIGGLASMLEPHEVKEVPGLDLGNLIQEELGRSAEQPSSASESPPEELDEPVEKEPSMDPTSKALLSEARDAKMAGELDEAIQTLRYVLIIDPLNAHARREVAEVEELQRRGVEKLGVTPDERVRLAIDMNALASKSLSPEEAFILTRLAAEPMRVRDLMAICPMGEHDTLKLVAAHLTAGHLEIVD